MRSRGRHSDVGIEVEAEEEETTAGDDSSVYVDTLSVCHHVASIRLLRTSLCRNDKEDGHLCVDQSSVQEKEEKGSDLGCRVRSSCDSLQCQRFGELGGWPSIVRSGECQPGYRTSGTRECLLMVRTWSRIERGSWGSVRATCTGGQRMAIERLADLGVDQNGMIGVGLGL